MKFRSLIEVVSILCLLGYFASCSASKRTPVVVVPAKSENMSERKLRKSITEFAKTKLGSKYKYANRGPKQFDCSGFTHYVLKEFDIAVPPVSREQEKLGKAINWKDAEPGDLLFYRRKKNDAVFHVSLVIENTGNSLKVIHATSSRGVVIDDIYQSSYWNSKIITARRIL